MEEVGWWRLGGRSKEEGGWRMEDGGRGRVLFLGGEM
jgi:hypothetical protein